MKTDALIAGGGAAGFYAAVHLARWRPDWDITLIEKSAEVLSKVRISGGGRCNVTHAEWDPGILTDHYPRGRKELLGPFHRHAPGDTVEFFARHGVELKIEADNRMFPVTDNSQTIIDCFLSQARALGIRLLTRTTLQGLRPPVGSAQADQNSPDWEVRTSGGTFLTPRLLLATGSSPRIWDLLASLGHRLVPPVPSLFTFKCNDPLIRGLPGVSAEAQLCPIDDSAESASGLGSLSSQGPLLITHWGLSGPAVLRLSAWGARELNRVDYTFELQVDWLPGIESDQLSDHWSARRAERPNGRLGRDPQWGLPRRLWERLVQGAGIPDTRNWGAVSTQELGALHEQLKRTRLRILGKSPFKEEFVTAGGIDLKEVDFRTFGSRLFPGLFFAGEILDIDGITGGFNFQNAWTGAYHAARAMANIGMDDGQRTAVET